ncbi:MAG: tetratricopeptide repeat protein [Xanthomonadales bacterium]|nr:tetratricopeptide repeat protein [Xanthomonadales bacterium]
MSRAFGPFLLLCLIGAALLAPGASWAKKDKGEDEVNYVELASVLVQDGNYERAEQALLNVENPAAEGVDTPRYYTVYGLIHLNRSQLELARNSFNKAIETGLIDEVTGETPEVIYIYLAQCHFGLEEYREAIKALDRAGETAERISSTWSMRAHAHWLLHERQRAFDVLARAGQRFPDNTNFLRRKVFYLIELGLYLEAAEVGRAYLERSEGSAEDHVSIGTALHRAGNHDQALEFLESAHLRYPESEIVSKVLAHTYLETGRPLAAAELFHKASMRNPELVSEAAELYRRAGKPYRALMLNGQIRNQTRKLQQRLAIFLQLKDYEQITTMEDALFRVGLLEDEDIRYALAYAWFQVGDYEKAEGHIQKLRSPELFRKGTELREAMEECKAESWRCA